jgi:pilus assembly protein TadC
MIQRIQTVYFIIVMVLLSSLLSGVEIFSFPMIKTYCTYSVYGIQSFKSAADTTIGKAENIQGSLLFYFVIAYVLFIYLALMSYKNLKRQYILTRLALLIYFVGLILLLLLATLGQLVQGAIGIELGVGYYISVVGLPLIYFAFKGVKKDKELLESLDRLR